MKNKIANFLKDFFHEWKVILAIILPVFLVLLYWDFQNINIGFLQLHSIDEYAFYGSLLHMLNSVLSGDLSGLFGYGFYQYGFIYFFINLLAVTPFILLDNTALALATPRIVISLFAIGGLVFIYKFARLYLERTVAILFTLFFITMPAFWHNATWFHPDWPMTFWLLGFVYFLARDNFEYGNNFKIGVIFYALAIAFKYQAITAMPILGLYIFYDNIRDLSFRKIIPRLHTLLLALAGILTVFVLSNPYILHPLGWQAFSGSFVANMESNSKNHGVANEVTITDKINLAVGDYYLNIIFFFIFNLAAFWLAWKLFRKEKRGIFPIIAINYLVNILYLFFFVNKDWQIYYLPVLMVGLLLLVYYLPTLPQQWRTRIVFGIIIAQLIVFNVSYHTILSESRDSKAPDYTTYNEAEQIDLNAFIVDKISPIASEDSIVLLSPYTPFTYEELGMEFDDVRVIFGAISKSNFDVNEYITNQRSYWGDLKTEDEIRDSFKPIDFIIIRKDIPFIDTTKLDLIRDEEPYLEGEKIMKDLYAGQLNYKILAENEYVVIFESTLKK